MNSISLEISPKSFLSYIMLKNDYKLLDIDYIKEREVKSEIKKGNYINMGIRKAFFKKVKRKFGRLKCQVCNNDNLIEKAQGKEKKSPNLATIEHVIPISEGGLKYVE